MRQGHAGQLRLWAVAGAQALGLHEGGSTMSESDESLATTNSELQLWLVAVFAHNEAAQIVGCLESIAKASTTHLIHAYVLANDCNDRTETVVRDFALTHPWVTLISLALGDKANAWNTFVYDVAPRAQICFFVDGDIRVEPGSFDALFLALHRSPEANAAAAVPSVGRSKAYLEQLVCKQRLILGNLYALRGEFVWQVKNAGVRVPIGYIFEDGLVTSLAKWNLDPTGPFHDKRVTPCPAARFVYRSFSLWQPRDWRTYWRRRVRYSLGHFQHEFLAPLLKSEGLRAMPRTVAELYKQQSELLRRCRPRLGVNSIFDSIAIARMRRQL